MKSFDTADHAFIREVNLSSVLRLIHSAAPLSRARLAAETGLNKSTVSSLVEDLLDRSLIHETGINSIGTGRPAMLLEINPQAGGIIGVELGVDFIAIVLTDFVGEILFRKKVIADPAASQMKTLNQSFRLIEETVGVCRAKGYRILGLSFSIPGTVELNEGLLIFAPNLNWHNTPIRKIFSERTGLKVFVENDANAAAIAEHLFGVAQKLNDFIFVFAGVGLGGGLFLNGQLYRGRGGYAGEIGHTSIMAEPFRLPCRCGNLGCWETYANQESIIRRMQARLDEKQDRTLSIASIKQAADGGDQDAIDSISEAGTAMGIGLAGLVNIFNPERVIIGGPISVVGDYLLPFIQKSVNKYSMAEIAVQTEVSISEFGPDASLIGAAAIVVDDILKNPTHIERR
ncbi:MAG TPA: ROK family transcriptional regulator [Anaerolineales bacterium]|nr:ROK family transcriptional regulator [Anaerolineales bacterium]